ncbi:helix-turn-helix transcriptional regulator [Streptacidiphilus fuscans]|uniref:Helix-turn-helix transcriptional regulator n=1 Tax=Streptacidiphilus fuscans TaxID=2789292 RepID=A0A931FII5_9ACTN|nr:helix-turn-helix transcriptional regulator [Streptacidiphilus fuscans]MBF9071824.1 helix-turn-helix transcriptional regulator [Streptacidiphilus fuscans]
MTEALPAQDVSPGTLQEWLKYWRSRVDPRRIPGLDASDRRKQGLNQDEVARLIGVTTRWYQELESGRRLFSTSHLERLALTLRLSEPEQRALYLMASHKAPQPKGTTDTAALAALDAPMQKLLDVQLPHPAYLSDTAWNIIGSNAPQTDWFPWVPYEPNLMRWAFLYPEAREQLVNWRDDWARPFLAQIHYALAEHPDNEDLHKLVADIREGNPEARKIWDSHEVQVHPDGDERRLRLPYHGSKEVPVHIMALAPLRNPAMRFIVLMAADD